VGEERFSHVDVGTDANQDGAARWRAAHVVSRLERWWTGAGRAGWLRLGGPVGDCGLAGAGVGPVATSEVGSDGRGNPENPAGMGLSPRVGSVGSFLEFPPLAGHVGYAAMVVVV